MKTVRQWGRKFGKTYSDRIRQRAPARGDKWHMDVVVVSISGQRPGSGAPSIKMASFSTSWSSAEERHICRAAADAEAPEIRRHAAARDDHGQAPFLRRCQGEDGSYVEHRQHKGLNNRAENSHQPTRRRERVVKQSDRTGKRNGFCRFTIRSQTSSTFPIQRRRPQRIVARRETEASRPGATSPRSRSEKRLPKK